MKRWHAERALMLRRWRQEKAKHAEFGQDCHCLRGPGFMRKRRAHDSHGPNQHCFVCELERNERRAERRRLRYSARDVIRQELSHD